MKFSNIIGQKPVIERLRDLINQNRLSHALLFLGKEGSGALPLAMAFANYIICERRQGETVARPAGLFAEDPVTTEAAPLQDACGQCPSCSKTAKFVHPDIHFSYPVIPRKPGDKPVSTDYISEWREFVGQYPYGNVYDWLQFIGAENKQGNITSAECAEIIRKLSLKSFESEYKILLLWMPEYLEKEGNKLLKIIEEPPPNTLFILVAESEAGILPTILSRCQLIKIPPIDDADIVEALMKGSGLSETHARQLAAVSEGNYREARLLVQHAEEDWLSLLREWLNALLKNGPMAQVKWVEEISKLGREKQKQFLRYFNHLLELAIRLSVLEEQGAAKALMLPENEMDFITKLNKISNRDCQEAIVKELDKASYYIERNANGRMLFHALTIKLYHIIADKSLILID